MPDLQITPEVAQAFNQANALFRQQRWAPALAGFSAVLEQAPGLMPAALQRARCLAQLATDIPGWKAARAAFEQVLRLDPANYSAWLEAGHLCRKTGGLDQALAAYQRAIDLVPDRHEALLSMARALEERGDIPTAQRAFADACQTVQDTPTALRRAYQHMGQARMERGDLERALPALRTALALATADTDPEVREHAAHEHRIDLIELLLRAGHANKAQEQLAQARTATHEATLARLSQLALRFNLWEDAIALSRRNLDLHRDSATAHWNLAQLLAECWQMDEARALLMQAEALAPQPRAAHLRASMASRCGDADAALDHYQALHAQQPDDHRLAASIAMTSLYSDRLGAPEVARQHQALFAPLGQGARPRASFTRAPLQGRRLRLGLVSADFHHQHPVNLFMQPVLRELDRSRIELFIYATGATVDDQTQLARARAEHWVEAAAMNDLQLARRIDTDAIDVLVDLSGHTQHNRLALFAQRAAPVQCTYLGYPGSTGVPHMDWLLGDDMVTPMADDALCSEQVWRLPHAVFCYAPEQDYPYPAYGPKHARRPLTFGSFNNVPKLTPRTLALWARILAQVPHSRLLLKAPSFGDPGAQQFVLQRLQALDVDPSRVEFRGPTGLADMMAEYADVDIALDPLPYNGGTTTLQALWMGVPVLTRRGDHFVSRMGASFLHAAGLPDWVAEEDDAYVALAVSHASDRPRLLSLKQGLRTQLQQRPAWDATAHTRALETAFEQMGRQWDAQTQAALNPPASVH